MKLLLNFNIFGIDRSKVAFMIYNIYMNNGKWIEFSEGKPNEFNLKACCECIKERLKTYFVPEGIEFDVVIMSEPEPSSFKNLNNSKSKNFKTKVMTNSEFKTSKIQILKRLEPKSLVLKNSEFIVLEPKFQRRKTIVASCDSKPKIVKPKVMNEQKLPNLRHNAQKKKSKTFSTNPK